MTVLMGQLDVLTSVAKVEQGRLFEKLDLFNGDLHQMMWASEMCSPPPDLIPIRRLIMHLQQERRAIRSSHSYIMVARDRGEPHCLRDPSGEEDEDFIWARRECRMINRTIRLLNLLAVSSRKTGLPI